MATTSPEEFPRQGDAELPEGVEVVARSRGLATKVAVTWSAEAPVRIAQIRQQDLVTALRIRLGANAAEADDEYWADEPDFDENNEPLPPPSHDSDGLAEVDFGDLRELSLAYFRIGDAGARALAAATSTGRMDTLDLRYCGIGDEGVAALAGSGNFGGLRCLRLHHNRITGRGVRALARFERLEELDLRGNRIGEDGARALIEAPYAGSLKRLFLHRPDVSDAGVRVLASAPQLPTALRSFWRSV